MLGKSPDQNQRNLFLPLLSDFIDMKHELVFLAHKIDWEYFESEFGSLYSLVGQPSIPLRLMIGCLILKQMYNLGDETVAKSWVRDPYMQYFCGEAHFQHQFPFDPSCFVHFRTRIGEAGFEKIFQHSVHLHGQSAEEKMVLSDTTVQENDTTFPTDAKLYKKVIDACNRMVNTHGLPQRQSYVRVSKQHLRDSYNANHPKRAKKARKARNKLRTIATRLVNELGRTLSDELKALYQEDIQIFWRIIHQQKKDKNKIYSPHKPYTQCIAKGKAKNPYEFGNKVGLIVGAKSLVITAIQTFTGNPHDKDTIKPLLDQMESGGLYKPHEVIYDRGGRGKPEIDGVVISTPGKPKKTDTPYEKRKKRSKFRRRAAIEPVIGHLKSDFRMQKNYLHGENRMQINALMSATAWNLRKLAEKAIFLLYKKWLLTLKLFISKKYRYTIHTNNLVFLNS